MRVSYVSSDMVYFGTAESGGRLAMGVALLVDVTYGGLD